MADNGQHREKRLRRKSNDCPEAVEEGVKMVKDTISRHHPQIEDSFTHAEIFLLAWFSSF